VLHHGDCMDLLRQLPDGSVDLVVTSPPYCMGKSYEKTRDLGVFLAQHKTLFPEIFRVVKQGGSICWQVGNHVDDGEVAPLDYYVFRLAQEHPELKLRNRIVWTFGHGLNCRQRFSGRHEIVLWFTKGDGYHFDLDPVRVKQKYPGKRGYKGKNKGKFTGNPLGKNPSDVWDIPNVKGKHPEKTSHPCQFPVALAQRLILALTKKGDVVLDPFTGSGSAGIAALVEGRNFIGAELDSSFHLLAWQRLRKAIEGTIRFRSHNRPIHVPGPNEKVAQDPFVIPFPNGQKAAS